jgi:hypothetical protein
MRAHHTRIHSTLVATMLAVFGLAASGAAAWAGDQGVCVTAHVPEAFTLPDGGMHPAGRLTLCMDRLLNPVVGLHRLSADGDGTALVMSRRSAAGEYTDSRPVLVFRRAPGTALDLVGYVVPFDHKSWKYTLKNRDGIGRFQATAHAAAPSDGELVMVIASNGN